MPHMLKAFLVSLATLIVGLAIIEIFQRKTGRNPVSALADVVAPPNSGPMTVGTPAV
jgi:hypothetical protein